MRAKRSRDDRLLDKFSKARAERIVQSAVPAVARTEPQHEEDEEDEELQVSFTTALFFLDMWLQLYDKALNGFFLKRV